MAKINSIKMPDNTVLYLTDLDCQKAIAREYSTGTAYSAGEIIHFQDAFYLVLEDITSAQNTGFSVIVQDTFGSGSQNSVGVEFAKLNHRIGYVAYHKNTGYSVGDIIYYARDGKFYKVATAITSTENTSFSAISSKLQETTIANEINSLKSAIAGGVHFRGVTTTALADNSTTNPIQINGSSYTAVAGDIVIYSDKEFIWDGSKWRELGSTGSLGALAFANTASGSASVSVSGSTSGVAVSITPTSSDKVSITSFGSGGSFSQGTDSFSAGSLPSFTKGTTAHTFTYNNGVLEIENGTDDSFSAGSLPSFSQGSDSFTPASGGTAVDVLKSIPAPVVTQGSVSASGTVSITVSPDA